MITLSTLQNPVLQCKLFAAMRWATIAANTTKYPVETGHYNITQKENGATVYIKNSRGRNFIRVDYRKGEPSAFRFYAAADSQTKCGYEITNAVLSSLRQEA